MTKIFEVFIVFIFNESQNMDICVKIMQYSPCAIIFVRVCLIFRSPHHYFDEKADVLTYNTNGYLNSGLIDVHIDYRKVNKVSHFPATFPTSRQQTHNFEKYNIYELGLNRTSFLESGQTRSVFRVFNPAEHKNIPNKK